MASHHLGFLKRYKPSGKAWIVGCVLCASVVAVVYAVCASDISVHAKGSYDVKINVGKGAQSITVLQHIEQKVGL